LFNNCIAAANKSPTQFSNKIGRTSKVNYSLNNNNNNNSKSLTTITNNNNEIDMSTFANVQELWAAVNLKLFKRAPYAPSEGNKGFCYKILKEVSRSFSGVILELPTELKDAVRVICKAQKNLFFL